MPTPKRLDEERRETVRRYHVLKDAGEEFERNIRTATSDEEKRRLNNEFSEFRRQHRLIDIERGKRLGGTHIQSHQIMWARWIEVSSEQEQIAAAAFDEVRVGVPDKLVVELRSSMVAITAAALAIEAFYQDVRYLVPEIGGQYAAESIANCLSETFDLSKEESAGLLRDLTALFNLRNEVVHGYSESEPLQEHPAGINTGASSSRFNAASSRTALRLALRVLSFAETHTSPHPWVNRWATERADYQRTVVAPIIERLESL